MRQLDFWRHWVSGGTGFLEETGFLEANGFLESKGDVDPAVSVTGIDGSIASLAFGMQPHGDRLLPRFRSSIEPVRLDDGYRTDFLVEDRFSWPGSLWGASRGCAPSSLIGLVLTESRSHGGGLETHRGRFA